MNYYLNRHCKVCGYIKRTVVPRNLMAFIFDMSNKQKMILTRAVFDVKDSATTSKFTKFEESDEDRNSLIFHCVDRATTTTRSLN